MAASMRALTGLQSWNPLRSNFSTHGVPQIKGVSLNGAGIIRQYFQGNGRQPVLQSSHICTSANIRLSQCCRKFANNFQTANSYHTIMFSRARTVRPQSLLQCVHNRTMIQVRNFKGKNSPKDEGKMERIINRMLKGKGRMIVRPFIFTAGVCLCSFCGALIWSFETQKKQELEALNRFFNRRYKPMPERSWEQSKYAWMNTLPAEKLLTFIIAVNTVVFAMWKLPVPAFRTIMTRYFSMGLGGPSSSLLLSAFSHAAFIHFFVNMYVFLGFSPVVCAEMGHDQFFAFYLSAAAVSSLGSYIHKVVRVIPRPSLGASGAIMAMLGYLWHEHGNTRVSIAFVSSIIPHSFSLDTAIKSLLVLDGLGVLLYWKVFDHAGHLGGLLFGYWYARYGQHLVNRNKKALIRRWERIRGRKDR